MIKKYVYKVTQEIEGEISIKNLTLEPTDAVGYLHGIIEDIYNSEIGKKRLEWSAYEIDKSYPVNIVLIDTLTD